MAQDRDPVMTFDKFKPPKIRKTLQLRLREDLDPKLDLHLNVYGFDAEGKIILLSVPARGSGGEEVNVTIISIHVPPHVEKLLIELTHFDKGWHQRWEKEYGMPGEYGVWYLDITLDGAWRYPPFSKGMNRRIFGLSEGGGYPG